MDKKRVFLNVFVGIVFKIFILFITLYTRKFLIKYVGNEANGVISLFTSVIGFLSIVELGVGSAITFCMYKPIIDNDNQKIAALFNLFKKIYFFIGIAIAVFGAALTPAMKFFAKDYNLDYNIYVLYVIQLTSVIITYFYSANISLINAFKNNYITTTFNSICQIIKCILQMIFLYFTKSLYIFLIIGIGAEILHTIMAEIYVRKKYKTILLLKFAKVDEKTKNEVKKNVKALFMHRIGGVFVNTIDSLVISTVLGVVVLGYYSNYITVINSILGIITLFFQQLVSVVGHSYYKSEPEVYKKYFFFFYYVNYFVASFSFICFFACVSPFINAFFGENLLLSDSALFVITINYFIQFMENAVRLFKDSSGLFYADRYKSIFEAIINLGLSIAFVYWIGLVGVIVATIITNIFICHIVEPHVLYKYAFKDNERKYLILNYCLIGLFVGLVFAYYYINRLVFNDYIIQFIINGFIASLFSIPSLIILIVYSRKKFNFMDRIRKRIKNKKNAME